MGRERATRPLSVAEAKAYYDRFGAKQDRQAFYEDCALDRLTALAAFDAARTVVEFGCGTGRLAARLLAGPLPADARYLGLDVSTTMVALARARLRPWAGRAAVCLTDGRPRLPLATGSADRLIATYVLDLLGADAIAAVLDEAARALRPGGLVGLVGLTPGRRGLPRLVSAGWARVYAWRPALVGGCRPLRLPDHLPAARWQLLHREVVTAWGVSSEVVVARSG